VLPVKSDLQAEFIRRICEKKLFSPSHLLGQIAPMVVGICANSSRSATNTICTLDQIQFDSIKYDL
jgi:hypothetical protein